MIEITAEVRAAIDRAAGDMELAGDEYIERKRSIILRMEKIKQPLHNGM